MEVYVLLKWTERRDDASGADTIVHSLHASEEKLLQRVDTIARANKQYKMQKLGSGLTWRIGPTEDQGFFGDSPVYLRGVVSKLEVPE